MRGPPDDRRDSLAAQRSSRGEHRGEHVRATSTVAAASPQPAGHRLTDVGRQRQPLLTSALAANQDFAVTPVHVAQLQSRNLADPQPEPQQHREHREVAASGRRPAVTGPHQPGRLARLDRPGQRTRRPAGCRGHRARQPIRREPGQIQIAQQRPHPDHQQGSRPGAAGPAIGKYELAHLGRCQAAQICSAPSGAVQHELPRDIDVITYRRAPPALVHSPGSRDSRRAEFPSECSPQRVTQKRRTRPHADIPAAATCPATTATAANPRRVAPAGTPPLQRASSPARPAHARPATGSGAPSAAAGRPRNSACIPARPTPFESPPRTGPTAHSPVHASPCSSSTPLHNVDVEEKSRHKRV